MEWAGVAADNAEGVAKEGHKLPKFSIVENRGGIPTRVAHGLGQRFFSGTVVDDAPQAKRISDLLAKGTEAFGRPAFGAPAPPRAEGHVTIDTQAGQVPAKV